MLKPAAFAFGGLGLIFELFLYGEPAARGRVKPGGFREAHFRAGDTSSAKGMSVEQAW